MTGDTNPGAWLEYSTVDVFTTTKFAGNPLAIVDLPDGSSLNQESKQLIAKEFNYSETVFLHPPEGGPNSNVWPIDIFTIESELPFAGHPVIGTACTVFGRISDGTQTTLQGAFITKAGRIGLEYDVQSQRARAEIPHNVHIHSKDYPRDEVLRLQPALQKPPQTSKVVSIVRGMTFILVPLSSVAELEATTSFSVPINAQRDKEWDTGLLGAYFYTRLDDGTGPAVRLRTRMFESTIGEDPATGSAACALASHLALQEGAAGETITFGITQGVEMGRASDIGVEVVLGEDGQGVKGIRELRLSGQAVKMMAGRLPV